MKLIYEGVDITNKVSISKAELTDNAGGVADSIELIFNDPKGLWSTWKPSKNDIIEISQNGLTSGSMYVDEIEQKRGTFIIRALSIPQEAKTTQTKAWESVRFLQFATEIVSKYGFTIESYGIENYLYNRVNQDEVADFQFLAWRCILEGYMLKIIDNKAVIYCEPYIESLNSTKTINIEEFDGDYKFLDKSVAVFNSCQLIYGNYNSAFKPANEINGPIYKHINSIFISSQGEADRYTKNLLRYKNKQERSGRFNIKLDTDISAGNNINIEGIGLADGKYFCEQVRHNLVDNGRSTIKVRRPLIGY
jgi:uncharacterized protein